MANMTFKASLLPNTDLVYSLGSSTQRWKINGYDPDARYVNITGDTMTGTLGFNLDTDTAIIKTKYNNTDYNIIRNHNNGNISISASGQGLYMAYENTSFVDWKNGGMYLSPTSALGLGTTSPAQKLHINAGLLAITNNGNTVTIGSQNSDFAHIYNSANIPFIFNKDILATDKQWLGSTSYPWGGLRLGGTSPSIQYQGSKANKDMIVMIDNTSDANGNGIRIGGGGLVIVGGGESASTLQSNLGYTGGSEATVIGSDGAIYFYPGQDSYDASAQLTMTASRFCAGVDGNTTREAQVQVASGGGSLYLWSPASTTSDRGLYAPAHGSGGAKHVIRVSTDNRVYFSDSYNDTPTALAYSQAGLAASAITWLTCWNGYELRAISKAEMANAVDSAHKWVRLAGDTMTGQLNNTFGGNASARHYENVAFYENNASSYTGTIKIKLPNTTSNMVMMVLKIIIFDYNSNSGCELLISGYTYNDKKWYNAAASPQGTFTKGIRLAYDGTNFCVLLGTTSSTWNYSKIILADVYSGYNAQPATGYAISLITSESGYTISQTLTSFLRADKVWGAVWNDYAEMREVPKEIEPGRCVREVGDDTMVLSTARLQRGCKIISDTFGFNIGETETAKTPIAVSGRALVYLVEGREAARTHIGWPVCSGPDGTVSIMTEEEEEKYPSRIVGTISSVPDYEEWGTGKVKVNGRIWIYVR